MKDIPKWLNDALSRPKKDADSDNAKPKEIDLGIDLPKDLQDFLTEAPMPDIYFDDLEATVPDIKIVDPDAPSGDKEAGFNPYDTARMHKK